MEFPIRRLSTSCHNNRSNSSASLFFFFSCLDHSSYFLRTKLSGKCKNAAGLMRKWQRLPIWGCAWDGLRLSNLLWTLGERSSFNLDVFLTNFGEIAQNPVLYCFVTEGKEFTACFSLTTARISRKNWNLCSNLPPASHWFLHWKLLSLWRPGQYW